VIRDKDLTLIRQRRSIPLHDSGICSIRFEDTLRGNSSIVEDTSEASVVVTVTQRDAAGEIGRRLAR